MFSLYIFHFHISSLVSRFYLKVSIFNALPALDIQSINFLQSWFSFVVDAFVSLRVKAPLGTALSDASGARSFSTPPALTPSILERKYGKVDGQSFLPFSHHILLPSPSLTFPSTTSTSLRPSGLHLIRHHK